MQDRSLYEEERKVKPEGLPCVRSHFPMSFVKEHGTNTAALRTGLPLSTAFGVFCGCNEIEILEALDCFHAKNDVANSGYIH